MIPAAFEYHRPATVEEALDLLEEHGEQAKLLAGGHSLIPLMKLRLAQPAHVIDLGRIAELRGIREEADALVIGAMTTHHAVAESELLQAKCPLLPETASCLGDVQVRHRGTIGGSAAHADPAADYPATLLALEAEFVVQSADGERTIPAAEFFVGMLATALAQGEVLTRVRIPLPEPGTRSSYQKFAQKASGFAICGVAALLTVAKGKCTKARVGITGVAPSAYRASAVEQALAGSPIQETTLQAAATRAADEIEALSDIHASADFRKELARVYTRRALEAAANAC